MTEQTAWCDWCKREVINFVVKPRMAEVTYRADLDDERSEDRICLMCFTDLIKLIGTRPAEAGGPARRAEAGDLR